jgi:hypothetical protein
MLKMNEIASNINRPHEVHVELWICDFDDEMHNFVTESVGVLPSKMYYRGKPMKKGGTRLSKSNIWIHAAPEIPYDPLNIFSDKMEYLLNILIKHKNSILNISSKVKYINVVLCLYENTEYSAPAIALDKKFFSLALELNIAIEFDLYA